jgi:hypothetical protein
MSNKTVSGCAVVIPVYKENLTSLEEVSLRRCLTALGEYPIIFAAPRRLGCDKHKQICSEYKSSVSYEFFGNKFFNGFNAYNALMFCGDFYGRFLNYKYILIYQLDAFVFENKLAFWCEQGYDYIGAPVFELRRGADSPNRTNFLNGGFSLRKTETFYKLAKTKHRFKVFFYLLMSKYETLMKKQTLFNILKAAALFSWVRLLGKVSGIEPNEDFEWSETIEKHGKIAPFDTALRFSFDSCPEYAFKLTGNSLPFGCHGWPAYYNRLFWKAFM